MKGDLAGEADLARLQRLRLQSGGVAEVGQQRIDRFHAGRTRAGEAERAGELVRTFVLALRRPVRRREQGGGEILGTPGQAVDARAGSGIRSEERRVGKEGVRTVRYRWGQ